jgi:pimeloyl-ACP methyl ester carboxylesterase
MTDGTLTVKDGRTVAFADYGPENNVPVLWCHGGPGSRLEPFPFVPEATRAGLRIIGIDRPGYGRSTVHPGRTIGGWAHDGLAVVDHLGIDRFMTTGLSTGGSHALALAVLAGTRAIGAVVCCGVTDLRWTEGKMMMPSALPVWNAPNREAAHAIVVATFGEKGELTDPLASGIPLADSDRAFLNDPAYRGWFPDTQAETFAQGVFGYVDDRLADGQGWGSFDVSAITCPVTVIHGELDTLAPVAHGRQTAAIVPGAKLQTYERLGHFSIGTKLVDALTGMLASWSARSA